MRGLFATGASFRADLNLTVQIVTGIVLVAGALLARAKRFRARGACMTAVLLLNLVMIALLMWPSFHQLVLPGLVKHPKAPAILRARSGTNLNKRSMVTTQLDGDRAECISLRYPM
jgi:hypothetical protein